MVVTNIALIVMPDYNILVNMKKQLEGEDNYHGSYETSSVLEVNSKTL